MPALEMMKEELPYFDRIVDSDGGNKEGWTPLLFSAQSRNLQIAKFLIDNGASTLTSKEHG